MSLSCIYIWRNKINNKLYCGQTRNLTKRNHRYKMGYFTNKHIESAVKKYGFSNFEQTIIETSPENLNILEMKIIKDNDLTNPLKGYNKLPGGDAKNHSEESKKLMSKAHSGVPLSPEHVRNAALSLEKTITLVSPSGIKYEIKGRKRFGRRLGIDLNNIKRNYHCKGWRNFNGKNDVPIENDPIMIQKKEERREQGRQNMIKYCLPKYKKGVSHVRN